ncbi:type II secretion system protein GspM [Rhodoferax sp.]|uniref:type II secretion system protein GspM n=1 Tax=Rhodoferax sp. TaxID=50421 RepID=UPI00271F21A1|nr:type II secretion system protein GspM [Rhodoferax sp.]MDO9195422.1 type II secretion system protein GspM [Rhodoferax sp.]
MKLPPLLQARWNGISRREQHLMLAALALMLAALLWWVGLAPALATLRAAESQHLSLDAQLQQVQRLQQQVKTLQAQPRMAPDDARRVLEASVKQQFGATAQMAVAGERVTVTLKGASADALAQWLAQARLNARVAPSEARLTRSGAGTWDGTLVLSLGTP